MAVEELTPGWRGELERAVAAWRAFLHADGFDGAARVAASYGWLGPALGLFVHLLFRTFVVYVADPVVMGKGYVFPGWLGALLLNFLFTISFAGLIWFLFFGTAGAFAGLLSGRGTNVAVFKVGGYLATLFVPLSVVAFVLALTISPAEVGASAIGGTDVEQVASRVMDVQLSVRATRQMQTVRLLRAVGWLTAAVLLRPMLEELYEIGPLRSTAALVLPTIAAIMASLLL
jgi:hypothetical protein